MEYLVTGNAGFIGYHVVKKLLAAGKSVVGFDVVNDYYETSLKESRLELLEKEAIKSGSDYAFVRENLANLDAVNNAFKEYKPKKVINLAAQAGIRYSLENPHTYVESNVVGFTNLLEACRYNEVEHLAYASTSSVYGANTVMPFSEHHAVDHPIQLYAATKRSNELMAHAYSHLFQLPTTGLRFFTVYGPWGRPDMALFLFTKNIIEGKPIQIFNHGKHTRDFTYATDIAEGVIRITDQPALSNPQWDGSVIDPAVSSAPFKIYNIGNNKPVELMEYIEAIEQAVGCEAKKEFLPRQPGDVIDTYADVSDLEQAVGYKPATSVQEGITKFVEWYRSYYKV